MEYRDGRLMKAFAPVPPEFEESIEIAFQRGALAMRRRRRFAVGLGAAAAFVVLIGVAALAAGNLGRPRPDNVVLFGGGAAQATPMTMASGGSSTRLPLQTVSNATPMPVQTASGGEANPTPLQTAASDASLSLEQRLTNVLTACIEEGGAQAGAGTQTKRVDKAVRILMEVPEAYGADTALWLAPIRECLLRELGLSEDYIAEKELVNLLVRYLRDVEVAVETATPMPTEAYSAAFVVVEATATPMPKFVYVENGNVELPYGEEDEAASVSFSVDAPEELFEFAYEAEAVGRPENVVVVAGPEELPEPCEELPARGMESYPEERAADFNRAPLEGDDLLEACEEEFPEAYEELLAHRTENYLEESVADFNRALLEEDGLPGLLEAYEEVMDAISPEDENYDFFALTLGASVEELYCEEMGKELGLTGSVERLADAAWEPQPGEARIWSEERAGNLVFYCIYTVNYAIDDPSALTVAERDGALAAFDAGLQSYVDGLSERELVSGNIRTEALTEWAEALAERLSTGNMRLSFALDSVAFANPPGLQSVRVETTSAPAADSLRRLLEAVLGDYDDGGDGEERSRRLESALAALLSIRADSGIDWRASVWECLVDEMGLSEEFVAENGILDQVLDALLGLEGGLTGAVDVGGENAGREVPQLNTSN